MQYLLTTEEYERLKHKPEWCAIVEKPLHNLVKKLKKRGKAGEFGTITLNMEDFREALKIFESECLEAASKHDAKRAK